MGSHGIDIVAAMRPVGNLSTLTQAVAKLSPPATGYATVPLTSVQIGACELAGNLTSTKFINFSLN